MQKMTTLTCAACNKPFQRLTAELNRKDRSVSAFYCSRACRQLGETLICGVCGASFYLKRYQLARNREHWCSRACADIGRKKGEWRACKTCGKPFYLHPSTIKNPTRTGEFCSNACQQKIAPSVPKGTIRSPEVRARMSAGQRGKRHPKAAKPPIEATCQQCGKTTLYSGYLRAHAKVRRFCSTACWYEHIREHPEKSSNWIDGYGCVRNRGPNWVAQSKWARERDGHLCQRCGLDRTSPALHVHHIRPFHEFRGDWESANHLSNLITLCETCHMTVERNHLVFSPQPA